VTSVQGKKLVVFGAGGASRAICVEMALAGASEITVVNISEDGQILVDMLNQHTPTSASFVLWDHIFNIPADTDIVINATSVGLYPNVEQRLNINADTLKPHMVVADCIPNPAYTHFVKDAISKGCRHVLPGMNMLVNQAVIALKYWTGNDVDADIMRQELTRVLGL
jgi:shikimate 5-dehydrogenase